MPVFLLVLMVALSCDDAQKEFAAPPQRQSIEAASAKVAGHLRREKPQAQIDESFAVDDLTTDAIWDRLHAQVVRVKEGQVYAHETFVLNGDKTVPIGRAFGGDGVASIVVADLAGDQKPLLVYSFAWGSGEHRSEVGILDLSGKQPKELRLAPVNFSSDDYVLRRADNGSVQVLVGGTQVGHVTATREGEILHAAIELDENLPNKMQRRLR